MTKQALTVLIVEDSPDDFLLLKEVLDSSEEIRVDIRLAERLETAISTANAQAVDAAILDLSLPDSFGLETFSAFYARFPTLPVIIMTGARDREMALKAVQKGAQDYLFKGESSPTAIVRTIQYAIERQRLTTELKNALEQVKQLQGMLPICSICKNIRNDKGYWDRIEDYISKHAEVVFSHSICPVCAKKHYPELRIYKD